MNKYQEALNYLDWYCSVRHTEQLDLLQELVDKRKPIYPEVEHVHTNVFYFYCGKCHEDISEDWTSCPYCTHEIDWIYDNWEDGE